MSTEIDRLEAVAAVVSHAGRVRWLRPELCEVGDQLCRLTEAQSIIAQRDARIAELEAERARWEHLAQKARDKSDVEFAADIATAIDAVGEKAQRPASQKGLAAQALKAQDAIKQWPPELRAGVRIPDHKEWLASGQPSAGVVDDRAAFERHWYAQHYTALNSTEAQRHFNAGIRHARLNPCRAKDVLGGKYAEVLVPFFAMMENEMHANAGKGDRPGWLQMNRETALLEIYYHLGKLQKATRTNDLTGIVEYAADVANMSMMLVDVCGLLATPSSAKKED